MFLLEILVVSQVKANQAATYVMTQESTASLLEI